MTSINDLTNDQIEKDSDELLKKIISKMDLTQERKQIEFLKKIYNNRCKLKFKIQIFSELVNDYLEPREKSVSYLQKIFEYLINIKSKAGIQRAELIKCTSSNELNVINEKTMPCTSTNIDKKFTVNRGSSIKRKYIDDNKLNESEKRAKNNLMKLNSIIVEYSNRIREYEDKELSLDDLSSDKSAYIIESKLKQRFVRFKKKYFKIAKQYPQLVNDEDDESEEEDEEKKKKIDNNDEDKCLALNISNFKQHLNQIKRVYRINNYNSTRYKELNDRLSQYFRKNDEFPNYCEIENLIETSNNELNLGLTSDKCEKIAKEVFKDIGSCFKKNREIYDRECLLSRVDITNELLYNDPAKNDDYLKSILSKHRQEYEEKYNKIIDEYAFKQEKGQDFEDVDDDDEDEDVEKSVDISDIDETVSDNIIENELDSDLNCKKSNVSDTEIITSTTRNSDIEDIPFDNKNKLTNNEPLIECIATSEVSTTTQNDNLNCDLNINNKTFHLNEDIKVNLLNRFSRNQSTSSTSSNGSKNNLPTIVNVTSTSKKSANAQHLFDLLSNKSTDEINETNVIVID